VHRRTGGVNVAVAWEYQNTVCTFLYTSDPIVEKNRDTPGLICSRVSLSSASKLHVGIGSSGILIPNVTRAAASFFAAENLGRIQPRAHVPGRICVYRHSAKSWLAHEIFVDIWWRRPFCFVKRGSAKAPPLPPPPSPPSHRRRSWVISQNSCDYSQRNWFAKVSFLTRSILTMLIRSYKPIFVLYMVLADWWYSDEKLVSLWCMLLMQIFY